MSGEPYSFSLDDAAAALDMPAAELAAFIETNAAELVASGAAHYEGDVLVIDGGGE